MKYDFDTLISRKNTGSLKWEQMYKMNPNVGENVVPLSVADMEFKNAPEITEGLREYLKSAVLGYTSSYKAFTDSIINWMQRRHNFTIKPEWIVNTAGVVPAFFAAIRAFTKPGDGVVIMSPVYYPFYNAIKFNERTLADCPLIEKDGYYTIDFEKFDEITQKPENKLFLFCSPHNPVGRVWTVEELKKLEKIILKNNVTVISDEIHHDIIMPGYKHTIFQTVSDEIADQTITCTAPSKTFNLAGMGISNIIIKNPAIKEKFIQEINNVSGFPFNILGYKACELAYTKAENWLEEFITVIDKNQKIVKEFFEKNHPKIKASLIEGTYLQWIDFRALGMEPKKMEVFMTKEAQLFLDEGYIFGKSGEGYERINLAAPSWVIRESLERLDRALKEL